MATADERIGQNVRRVREIKGLSQAELAKRIERMGGSGFYPQTITKIEKGQRALKLVEATMIAAALETTLDQFAELELSPDEMRLQMARLRITAALNKVYASVREFDAVVAEGHQLGIDPEVTADQLLEIVIKGARENPDDAE